MAEVIDFQAEKEGRDTNGGKGWFGGMVKCLACGHHWSQVAPIPIADAFECPACGLERGVPDGLFGGKPDEPMFTCGHCDNQLFKLTQNGPLCICCGDRKEWPL